MEVTTMTISPVSAPASSPISALFSSRSAAIGAASQPCSAAPVSEIADPPAYQGMEVTTMNNETTSTEPTPPTSRSPETPAQQAAPSAEPAPRPAPKATSYPFRSKAQILAQLASDPAFQLSCLVILFNRQTAYEQTSETTLNRNRAGFMSSHAVHGSRIAKKHLAGEELTAEDLGRVEAIVSRYSTQLAKHFRNEAVAANPELAKVGAVFGV